METLTKMTDRIIKISAPAKSISLEVSIDELDLALSDSNSHVVEMSSEKFWELLEFWRDLDSQLELCLPMTHEETYIDDPQDLLFFAKKAAEWSKKDPHNSELFVSLVNVVEFAIAQRSFIEILT